MKVGNAIRPESRRSCIVNESAESVGRERERQTDRQTERQRAREPPSWQTAEEFHFGPPSLGSSHARPPKLSRHRGGSLFPFVVKSDLIRI